MRAFALGFVLLVSVSASAEELSCQTAFGGTLCRAMDRLATSLTENCAGNGCFSLWQRQLDMMRNLVRNYEQNVSWGTPIDSEMGGYAYIAADAVCRVRQTGPCDWMKALYTAKVDAMYVLKEIQENASLSNVKSCQLTYICP